MSERVHVIAARDVGADEFHQVLTSLLPAESGQPACQPFRFGSSGNWQWAYASVWQVGAGEIDQALVCLPGASLRTTTSDGILWMLTVAGGGRELFRGVHFFCNVERTDWDRIVGELDEEEDPDFPEHAPDAVAGIDRDDPELQFLWDEDAAEADQKRREVEAAAKKPWQEYLDYGVTFPAGVLRRMEGLSALAAQRMAFYAHAEQIADELVGRGVPFDRHAVVQLLTVGPLTKREQESDLGNLPRFLSLLGVVGWCDESLLDTDDAEEMERFVDWSRFQSREQIAAVCFLTAGREPVPVTPESIDLTLAKVVHLMQLSHYCDADDGPVMISLRFPTGEFELAEAWTKFRSRGIEVERDGSTCTIAFNPIPYWLDVEDRKELAQHSLVQALGTLADGVELELTHSVAGTRDGCHRYRGVIHSGGFRLTAAHPHLETKVVSEALEVLDLTLGKKSIPIANAFEEQRIREAYHNATGQKPRIREGKIKPEAARHAVVRCKFVTMFLRRGIWDVEGAERRRAELAAEIDSLFKESASTKNEVDADDGEADTRAAHLQEMIERAQRARLVPRSDRLIFDGKVSRYFHAPIFALEHVTADEISEKDRQMAELGFSWVCDSASEKFGETISRNYAGVTSAIALYERRMTSNSFAFNSDGVLLDFSRGAHEFQTYFRDGSTLVTNDIEGASSMPKQRIFVRTYEGLSVADLWAKHLDGVARLAQRRNTQPLDHTEFSNPASFARIVDSLMHRYLGGPPSNSSKTA